MKRGPQGDPEEEQSAKKARRELPDLPLEMWAKIAQNLEEKELTRLQRTCRIYHSLMNETSSPWQPLLDRIHAMDSSICTVVTKEQTAREVFIQGLVLLQASCKAEVLFLREHHNVGAKYPLLQQIDVERSLSLNELEALDAELNTFNADIIHPYIAAAINNQFADLNISCLDLTRLPESLFLVPNYQYFWQNLESLACSYNQFRSLPENLGRLQALKQLYCHHNQLQSLPESIGRLQALLYFDCTHNQLRVIPESFGDLQALVEVYFIDNKLQFLPESIGKLKALRYLYCAYNQLQSLPESIGSLSLEELICSDNLLQTLPKSIIGKLDESWASETLASQRVSDRNLHNS
ncbi:MAG: leucine-rich repeat domain-containing protein [Proteobacteria bacterium]|nr:leucine-rich repeat domain-containing protein [Pseudomonadota bacterium]